MSRGLLALSRLAARLRHPRRRRRDVAGRRRQELARTLDRIATMTAAGVPAERAIRQALARRGGASGAGGCSEPPGAPSALLRRLAADDPGWDEVAAVFAVGDRTGARTADTLVALASALREQAAAERAVRVALAGPETSSRVVLALPLLGMALGSAWGQGPLALLFGTLFGWCCIGAAGGLVLLAGVWSRRLVRAATPNGRVVGIALDAWAVAVSGGGSWLTAASAVEESGLSSERMPSEERTALRDALDLADDVGVPAAALLRAAAVDLRRERAALATADAERLGVRLVLPLGVCVLPAFVLVGVVPVVATVLSSTVSEVR